MMTTNRVYPILMRADSAAIQCVFILTTEVAFLLKLLTILFLLKQTILIGLNSDK